MTWTISRHGSFMVSVAGADHCGKPSPDGYGRPTVNHCFFEAEITVKELDEHGFVIDNSLIRGEFDKYAVGTWAASCESIATGALRGLNDLCKGRAKSIRVRVYPFKDAVPAENFAAITLTWEKGEPLPTNVPVPWDGKSPESGEEETATDKARREFLSLPRELRKIVKSVRVERRKKTNAA